MTITPSTNHFATSHAIFRGVNLVRSAEAAAALLPLSPTAGTGVCMQERLCIDCDQLHDCSHWRCSQNVSVETTLETHGVFPCSCAACDADHNIDASRFLAQSQSRLSLSQNDPSASRTLLDRQQGTTSRGAPTRGYLQRRPHGNPYAGGAASQASRFPFASRGSRSQAPLFYSATDEFRDEDDGQEHEREAADFFALQHSRRDFSAGPMARSSSPERAAGGPSWGSTRSPSTGRGIRSSWTEDESDSAIETFCVDPSVRQNPSEAGAGLKGFVGRPKDRLVDVELASTIQEIEEPDDSRTIDRSTDEQPPSLQHIRKAGVDEVGHRKDNLDHSEVSPFSRTNRGSSPDRESIPTITATAVRKPERYDAFWSTLFLIDIVAVFSTFLLVLLHTRAPGKLSRLGDTIYSVMASSFYLLAIYTLVAVVVALLWIAALRSFVRPLVFLMLVAVPVIALSFSLYPLISSFGGKWHGTSIQDRIMRWASLVPGAFAIIWAYTAYKGRHALGRAISLLEFATRILGACSTLVIVGFATLALVVCWTWIWMLMFTRLFLGGHSGKLNSNFIIDTSTWWLGAYFFLTFLWSLGVIAGVQRATTAATTSQWYFYRNAIPAPPPQSVVRAAFVHASTKVFGTICLSTLLALAVRLPLLILPGRLSGYMTLCFYSLVPASIATLTNPLTLTYAAIHSQPLGLAARGLSELTFVAPTGVTATTALTPHAFSQPYTDHQGTPSLFAYRLAKMLLHATRLVASMAFGLGGWVSTARSASTGESGSRGSLYAYIVGLMAGAIGWAVLGAVEGVLSGVLDAVVICWGSEMQSHGHMEARFCREAGELLTEERTVGL